jgi:hypothetical protein
MKNQMFKHFYLQAISLPDDKLFAVRYEITKDNYGKIALSNSIDLFTKKQKDALKKHLLFIEKYAVECYIINKPQS